MLSGVCVCVCSYQVVNMFSGNYALGFVFQFQFLGRIGIQTWALQWINYTEVGFIAGRTNF